MSRVFVSYRRDDSAGAAGRLYERLVREFGEARVFMDVEGGIPHGADFPTEIARALKEASALLVVIGRHWLTSAGADGRPRIQDEADWVVTEIATALERGIFVLPVLVDGAVMPQEALVSKRIAALARKQAVDIRASSWQYDLDRIVTALSPVVGTARGTTRRRVAIAAAVTAVAIAAVVAVAPFFRATPAPAPAAVTDVVTPDVTQPAPGPAPSPAAVVTPTPGPGRQSRRGGPQGREGPDPSVTPSPPSPQPTVQPPTPLPAAVPVPVPTPTPSPQPPSLRDQAIAAAEGLNPNDARDADKAKQALDRAFGMTGNQLQSLGPADAVNRVVREIRATNDQDRLEAALQILR